MRLLRLRVHRGCPHLAHCEQTIKVGVQKIGKFSMKIAFNLICIKTIKWQNTAIINHLGDDRRIANSTSPPAFLIHSPRGSFSSPPPSQINQNYIDCMSRIKVQTRNNVLLCFRWEEKPSPRKLISFPNCRFMKFAQSDQVQYLCRRSCF